MRMFSLRAAKAIPALLRTSRTATIWPSDRSSRESPVMTSRQARPRPDRPDAVVGQDSARWLGPGCRDFHRATQQRVDKAAPALRFAGRESHRLRSPDPPSGPRTGLRWRSRSWSMFSVRPAVLRGSDQSSIKSMSRSCGVPPPPCGACSCSATNWPTERVTSLSIRCRLALTSLSRAF